jgi:hypothetical protein
METCLFFTQDGYNVAEFEILCPSLGVRWRRPDAQKATAGWGSETGAFCIETPGPGRTMFSFISATGIPA